MKSFKIYTDGGSRGNPGPSALGVYIEDSEGKTIARIGRALGIQTNNYAEYHAVLQGINYIIENPEIFKDASSLDFFMDSNLAASQLNGLFKIKNAVIRNIIFEIRKKETEIKSKITYTHVRREKNTIADSIVNMVLDKEV